MGEIKNIPTWFEHQNPLVSAVNHVSALSEKLNWVGIYLLKDEFLILGPFVGAETEHTRIPVGRGICGRAVAENRDLNIPDVAAEENYIACSLSTRSELVVLIRDPSGRVVAQLDIDSDTRNAFSAELE